MSFVEHRSSVERKTNLKDNKPIEKTVNILQFHMNKNASNCEFPSGLALRKKTLKKRET